MKRAKILYLSYDGLTDPLGRSQVLPYLLGLASKYDITLVTFEKPDYYKQYKEQVIKLIDTTLDWIPQKYTKQPPIFSTAYDLLKLRIISKKIVIKKNIEIVHCRSYITSIIGLWLKRKYNIGFIFDMRGFWADERVEGGLWNLNNPLYKFIYNYFKILEKNCLTESNQIISLTNKAIQPLLKIGKNLFKQEKINIIPCCVDTELFSTDRVLSSDKEDFKTQLGYSKDDKILIYVGSIGTWYMLNEMLDFYWYLQGEFDDYKLLIITRDNQREIIESSENKGIDAKNIRVKIASREEVPKYIGISDLSFYFIRPTFSKLASSPTKLAEFMSFGIPIITNSGIGDIEHTAAQLENGIILINSFNEEAYKKAIYKIPSILPSHREGLRNYTNGYFSLRSGIEKYDQVYQKMLK